jgi:ADP-heptose:LPS heptosyltransferase
MNIKNNLKAFFLRRLTKKNNFKFNIQTTKKILMFRYDRIGDMIITTPVFRELKKHYPEIEISVLASKSNFMILKNNPYVDHIYINNKNNLLFDLLTLFKIRRQKIDICIEFDHSVVRHAIIRLQIINPKKTISVQKDGRYGVSGDELEIYNYYTPKNQDAHFRDVWLATLNPFGIQETSNKYDIFFEESTLDVAQKFVDEYKGKFLIGINLEGTVKGKKISYRVLEKICLGLFNITQNIQIFINYMPEKEFQTQKAVSNLKMDYLGLSYKTQDILDAAALIKNMDLVITPDTSIVHIASAFNIPVITIHEDNVESYKLFSPTSDLSRTVFSKKNNSLEGFPVKTLIDLAKELISLINKK